LLSIHSEGERKREGGRETDSEVERQDKATATKTKGLSASEREREREKERKRTGLDKECPPKSIPTLPRFSFTLTLQIIIYIYSTYNIRIKSLI